MHESKFSKEIPLWLQMAVYSDIYWTYVAHFLRTKHPLCIDMSAGNGGRLGTPENNKLSGVIEIWNEVTFLH